MWCSCVFLGTIQGLLVKHLSFLSHFYTFATLVGGEWNEVKQRGHAEYWWTDTMCVKPKSVGEGGSGTIVGPQTTATKKSKSSVLIWCSEQDILVFVGERIEVEWTWNPTNPAANERRIWHWTRSANQQQWGLSCTESARVVHPAVFCATAGFANGDLNKQLVLLTVI